MKAYDAATELIVKYKNILPRMDYHLLNATSQDCAMICVKELIKNSEIESEERFWQEVLDILENYDH